MSWFQRLTRRFFRTEEEIAAEAVVLAEQHAAPYRRPYPFLPHNSSFVPPLPARRPEPVTNLPPTPPTGEGKDGSAQMPGATVAQRHAAIMTHKGRLERYQEPTLKLTVALPAEFRSELVLLVNAIVGAHTGKVPLDVIQRVTTHTLAQIALSRRPGGCRSGRCGVRRQDTPVTGKTPLPKT